MPAPAASLLPPAFGSSKPEYLWRPADIPENGSERLYLASEIQSGWRYYTESRQVRLSREFPENYMQDVGYAFGHGPGKGPDKQDRGKPTGIWLVRAWHVEREMMIAAIIDSFNVQSSMTKIMANDSYIMTDAGLTNFYIQIFNDKEPPMKALKYTCTGNLRTTKNKAALHAAQDLWFPEQYWRGLNPFEPPADPTGEPPVAHPTVMRDENGADVEPKDLKADDDDDGNW